MIHFYCYVDVEKSWCSYQLIYIFIAFFCCNALIIFSPDGLIRKALK